MMTKVLVAGGIILGMVTWAILVTIMFINVDQGVKMTMEEAAIPLALLSVIYTFYLTYRLYTIGNKNDDYQQKDE